MDIEELKAELDKQIKRYDEAKSVIDKQGNELGELRSWKAEAESGQADAEKQIADLKKKVEALTKEPEEEGGDTLPTPAPGPKEETLEEIEASLSDEQWQAADAAFEQGTDDEKIDFTNDPEKRKAFLLKARDTVKSVPKSLRDTPAGARTPDQEAERLDQLFNLKREQSVYAPPGSNGLSPAGGTSDRNETRPSRPVGAGGVLEAIRNRS